MTLFEECLEALGKEKEILTNDETRKVFKSFTSAFPITKWGVVDWAVIQNKHILAQIDDVKYILENYKPNANKIVCIIWNDSSLPSIRVGLDDALRAIDDVTAVSFDTWIYNEKYSYIIEFHHEGRITIGML